MIKTFEEKMNTKTSKIIWIETESKFSAIILQDIGLF